MATSSKPSGRVVGRSTTSPSSKGTVIRLDDPLDKGYLCGKMCDCNAGTALVSKSGQILKQRCVSARIWLDEELNQLVWGYKAEVGYSMKANPPAPLMSSKNPHRPSRFPLGAAIGEGVLKRSLEGKIQKGLLRIPDCIILKISGAQIASMRAGGIIDWKQLIPVKRNIKTVVEMKFVGDVLSVVQVNAYRKIGGPSNFRLLEIGDCDCGKKRERPATDPVRVPVKTPLLFTANESSKLFDRKPVSIPVPQPMRPQYGPLVAASESTALSSILKAAAVTAGVIVIGAIVVVALPEIAVGTAVMAAGRVAIGLISLAVVTSPANAAPSRKGK